MTYGNRVTALRCLAAGTVAVPWLARRLPDLCKAITRDRTKIDRVHSLMNILEIVYKIFNFVNLLIFIREGYYSTVGERIFKLRPIPTLHPKLRQISYSWMKRELLYDSVSELMCAALPLVPFYRLHSLVKSFLPQESSPEDSEIGNESCVICGDLAILPHQFGCSHFACFYCVFSQFNEQNEFQCSRCMHKVTCKSLIVKRPYRLSISNNI